MDTRSHYELFRQIWGTTSYGAIRGARADMKYQDILEQLGHWTDMELWELDLLGLLWSTRNPKAVWADGELWSTGSY